MDNRHPKAIQDELERIERLKREAARMIEAERRRLMALEQKRQEIKRRLASIGICPVGYAWQQEGSGFRCGGGLHVVSFGELGLSSMSMSCFRKMGENTKINL
jgi:hypothetical protein